MDPETNQQVQVRYDVATGKRTVMDQSQREETRSRRSGNTSPDDRLAVYNEQGNLHVRDLGNDRTVRLTNNAVSGSISNGSAIWSPDSKWIAFIETDRSDVPFRASLIPNDPTYPEVRQSRYARVGEPINKLRVGVVDSGGKAISWLAIPLPTEGCYIEQISWIGNSHDLFVKKFSRGRDEREFFIADIRTGEFTCIYRESDPAWVVSSRRENVGPEWFRNYGAFIVISEKDGWRHAYLYSRDGMEQALLTPGDYDIIEFIEIDESGGWFYYYASPDNATQKYLYRARLDGSGKTEQITPANQPGTHSYNFSPDFKWAFHTYSTFDTPPVTVVLLKNS
ncbi:MAG: hypothetical protein GY869_04125 [Planctomycetes bacterium]|nr:hypothetical protein [Planctomycetota bacterium]